MNPNNKINLSRLRIQILKIMVLRCDANSTPRYSVTEKFEHLRKTMVFK